MILKFGDAEIRLTQQGQIQLKNTHSQIELSESGSVQVNGKQIQQKAQQDIVLTGERHIHLNSPTLEQEESQ